MEAKLARSRPSPRCAMALVSLVAALLLPQLAHAATRQHTLRWIAPSDPDLAGYEVYLALRPGAYQGGVDIGARPAQGGTAQYALGGLDDSIDYWVALRAYDQAGNRSAFSNEIKIARVEAPPVPTVDPTVQNFALWGHRPPQGGNCFQPTSNANVVALSDPFSGGTLDLSQHACPCFGVEARGDADVRSMRITHSVDGVAQADLQEGGAPFAYQFAPGQLTCTEALRKPGQHVIVATPCSAIASGPGACSAGGGVEGPAVTLRFNVTGVTPEPVPQEEPPATGCEDAFDSPGGPRLAWTGDPDTTMTVVWDAAFHVDGAQLRHRQRGTTTWKTLDAALVSFLDCDARYRVELAGLQPSTAYEYQVNTRTSRDVIWSPISRFITSSSEPEAFSFSFFASSGLAGAEGSDLSLEVMDALGGLRPHVALGGGGYAYAAAAVDSGVAADPLDGVERWLDQASRFARSAPFMPTYGDTDVSAPEDRVLYTAAHPSPSVAGAAHRSYAFDAHGVHFVSLDAPTLATLDPATPAGTAHLAWLDADLAAARSAGTRWIVVYMHADLFSSQTGATENTAVRNALGRILTRHEVALVLSGDATSYERTHALRFTDAGMVVAAPGASAAEYSVRHEGTVFLRAGTGGRTEVGEFPAGPAPAWSAARDAAHGSFARVTVAGPLMTVRVVGLGLSNSARRTIDRAYLRFR
jgi:hypothetical protein